MRRLLGPSLILAGFAAGAILVGSWSHGQPAAPPIPRELTSYRDIVKRILPAVVYIETRAKDRTERLGFGSGFFVSANGVVVTNYHVLEGADVAIVQTHDGRKFSSRNLRTDRRTDLAVVLLDAKDERFTALELGDSDAMEIGDRVLAVGAPFGLAGSVTQGIISGKARSGLAMNFYEDFLQTDAAINPGNSGGPLVSLDGKVVGINAAIKSKTGGFQGVGLATSSNLAKSVIAALQKDGIVKRGYLGAHIRDIEPAVAAKLGLDKSGAVIVAEVFDKTPASKAGLKAGDIIVTIGGKAAKNADVLQRIVAALPIDQAADVDVLRETKLMRLTVVIEEQPAEYGAPSPAPAPRPARPQPTASAIETLGVEVAELTDDIAADLGMKRGTQGVVITRVHEKGLAAASNLRPGTIIAKIDETRVGTPADAQKALQNASLTKGIILQIITPQGGASYVLLKNLR